ncbi:DUF502 domain-containing protein [Synechococcus elongatus]|uniref:DUF502 domain-containing protein n=1 Tax=Synechococcus elongatus PCC 11801 TaxID=2219813 RepID=A0AAN1QMN8_SYNEL|nr:DUF502 domain-containing protein [Synechococcus elongatus]AZB72018.1 hypothetical protein DOP62_04090 [Synechococcus elongatus PCC 11801]
MPEAPDRSPLSFWQRLRQDLKNDLIAGLLVVIPLATTIWLTAIVSRWVVNLLTGIPKQVNPFNDLDPFLSNLINLGVGLTVPLLAILVIGLMARNIVGRFLLDFGERTLQAIPLAGSVYKTLKQLLETVLKDNGTRFRRVVLVEYPRKGLWSVGFVTGNVSEAIQAKRPDAALVSVFIPSTPNPTTGWYAVVCEEELQTLEMSVEDAFKILISGGIVAPKGNPVTPALSSLPEAVEKVLVEATGTGKSEEESRL